MGVRATGPAAIGPTASTALARSTSPLTAPLTACLPPRRRPLQAIDAVSAAPTGCLRVPGRLPESRAEHPRPTMARTWSRRGADRRHQPKILAKRPDPATRCSHPVHPRAHETAESSATGVNTLRNGWSRKPSGSALAHPSWTCADSASHLAGWARALAPPSAGPVPAPSSSVRTDPRRLKEPRTRSVFSQPHADGCAAVSWMHLSAMVRAMVVCSRRRWLRGRALTPSTGPGEPVLCDQARGRVCDHARRSRRIL